MSESSYPVGYGRPPEHTRFQKGQSGNPSGRPKRDTRLKDEFRAAIRQALKTDRQTLKDAKPATMMEAIARGLALKALEQPSARKLVLSVLDDEPPRVTRQKSRGVAPGANSGTNGAA